VEGGREGGSVKGRDGNKYEIEMEAGSISGSQGFLRGTTAADPLHIPTPKRSTLPGVFTASYSIGQSHVHRFVC
jgi:hypothetical protein